MSTITAITPLPVSAESSSVTGQQITITAVVLPAIYVLVNGQNQVQEIISNTTIKDTVPTIYKDSVQIENIQPLTVAEEQQVTTILRTVLVKPGVIYKKSTFPMTAMHNQVLSLLIQRHK